MSTKSPLDLIVVNYNSTNHLKKLIRSTKKIPNLLNKIIIIDNNSNNFDLLEDKNIKIIKNKKNLGFAKAVNQGIKLSKSELILLLNPDTYFTNSSIKKTLNLIKNNTNIGVVGGKIFFPNHKIYLSANNKPSFLTGLFEFTNLKKIFPKNKYSKNFWIEQNIKITKPIEVSSICGAYMIFRRMNKNKLNLFNEDYFMYMEDVDFGIKNNKNGFKVIFDPNSSITHIGGVSSPNKYRTSLKYWYKSRRIFFKKHLPKIQAIILNTIFIIEESILRVRNILNHEKID